MRKNLYATEQVHKRNLKIHHTHGYLHDRSHQQDSLRSPTAECTYAFARQMPGALSACRGSDPPLQSLGAHT